MFDWEGSTYLRKYWIYDIFLCFQDQRAHDLAYVNELMLQCVPDDGTFDGVPFFTPQSVSYFYVQIIHQKPFLTKVDNRAHF